MKIGFIGLGAMGAPMAARLLGSGHDLTVYDPNGQAVTDAVAKGAKAASSPVDVASKAEVVFVSLPTPDVVREVALGAGGIIHGSAVKYYVDLSTTGAKTAVSVAKELAAKNIVCLDAPVSGGVPGAVIGTLAVMVSGDQAAYDQLAPMLKTIGSRTTYVGKEVGQGQMLKLVNNLLAATSLAAASEALVLGMKSGLDLETMLEVINVSSGRSFATEKIIPSTYPNRSFDFGFKIELMHKDVRLCLEEAEHLQVPMWLGNSVKQMWSFAVAQGAGKKDFSAIVEFFENWSGVKVGSGKS